MPPLNKANTGRGEMTAKKTPISPANPLTIEPLKIPPRFVPAPITPEAIRLPAVGGHDPYFGMTRSALNELILPTPRNDFKPPVRSFVLRRKGSRTGIRLVDFASLKNFILAHAETGTVEVG